MRGKFLSKGNNVGLDAKLIRLSSVEIRNDDTFVYHYDAGTFMRRFLADEPLWVRYEGSVKDIPPGMAAIPFLGIISQIIWFYGGTLDIPVLDTTYAESMDSVKDVCQSMYPEINLSGKVNIGKKTSALPRDYPRKGAFFTGDRFDGYSVATSAGKPFADFNLGLRTKAASEKGVATSQRGTDCGG